MTASIRGALPRPSFVILTTAALVAALLPVAAKAANPPPPAPVQSGASVSPAVHMDVSQPLYEILELQDRRGEHEGFEPKRYHTHDQKSSVPGTPTSTTSTSIPATTLSFDGVGNGFSGPQGTFTVNAAPPDTNLSVGPNHVVEIVNTDFAVFNKSGGVLYGPVTINTLWSGFGGGCQTNNDGDPIAKYDSMADRWVISQFSVSTTPYLQCVAVSTTPDPTGSYYRYSFQYNDFPDYPKMSVWPDAYYITFNMFRGGTTFSGGEVCAYDRTKMLAGQAATQQCFNVGTTYGGLLGSDVDGSMQPPAGSPDYIVADGASANQLAYWKFHVDFTTPANATLTGPTTLATAAFTAPCGGSGGTCVPQAGTTQQLDTLGDRIMYRAAYRNFGDHEAMVVNRSVTVGSSVGIRWYELRTSSGNNLGIYQQGTYAPDSTYRWMGSIALDKSGDMALGFSTSSSSTHPGIHYTGRLAADALGTMSQGEATVIDGPGSQTGQNLSRWGDYSAMAVDPSDDCTFWYGNEYIPSNGAFNWKTRIATFKFPSCGSTPPANDFSISASPGSQTVNQGAGTSYTVSTALTAGSAQTVNLSASGLPSGASATFNPTSVTSGGSSTMSVTTSSSTPGGTYTLTITGTGTSATHNTTVSLVVNGPAGITNGGFETGNFTGWTTSGTTSISTTPHSGSYSAMAGGTSPTNGDSTIAQTFTAPSAGGTLTFWYQVHCPDTLTYDWANATLADNTASTSTTLLSNTCSNAGTWVQSSGASLAGGHSYTLTLLNHDDNYPSDPTYTLFDDVAIAAPPAPDFTISASPSSQTVTAGAGTSYTVTITAQNGFNGVVQLTSSGYGNGASGSFTSASVTGSGSSTLSVTTTSSAATGSFPITITGTSGALSHNAGVTLVVNPPPTPDFTISATPSSQSVVQGNSTTYTASVTAQNGFTGTVIFSVSGLPSGATGTFNPASVTGTGSSTLTVTTATSTPAGTYSLTITGTSGSLAHSTGVTLVVNPPPDFTISASPSSQTVTQGNGTTYTVTVTAQNGFTGTVNLSSAGYAGGATGAFNPASVNGGGTSTLTVSTSGTAQTGTSTITITGTSGSLNHSTNVSLTVNPPPATVIVNGGFETGNFTGWSQSGATSISSTAHSGSFSAQVGSANPFNGDSSIAQTFTAPSGTGHTLSFWYRVVCTDSVRYDWATATLRDNTTGTTTTILSKTCSNNGTWAQKSVSLTGGDSYTLTLIDHDDNWASPPDPTYTLYDDVTVT